MADKRKTNSEKKQKSQAATLKKVIRDWKIQNFSRIFNSACNCICCAYTLYSKADRTCS